MPAPTIYRSSDSNAPPLSGVVGSLISVLDACLVDGYGSTFATATVTSDGTLMSDGDTVTIDGVVYTFRTSLTAQPAYAVFIGGSTTTAMINLQAAIIGGSSPGSTYSVGTLAHPTVWAGQSGNVITLNARKGGAAANSIAISRSAAHITVSGANLSGGGGSNTKVGAGWTKSFSGSLFSQAVYKQPAGCGFYLQVDDSGPGAGVGRVARTFGFETMTAWNTGTGQFPTVAQFAGGAVYRKSSTQDAVARPWVLLVDDRTLYLFVQTGDSTTEYIGHTFGDFYSFNTSDSYKCLSIGAQVDSASALTSHPFPQAMNAQSSSINGHWLPRNFAGVGGSTVFIKNGDSGLTASSAPNNLLGLMMMPNGSDGGLYLAPVRMIDGSTPGTSITGSFNLRGRMRGLWHAPYPLASFADGDTFAGSGDLAGRSFMVVRNVLGSSSASAFVVMETTAWDTSA